MARMKEFTSPIEHNLRLCWNRSRAQARSRNETWEIPWEDYYYIWTRDNSVSQKGRGPDSLCLARIDPLGPWSTDNVRIETRAAHFQRLYTGVPKIRQPKTLILD